MAHKENEDLLRKLSYCQSACKHCADACLSEDNIEMMVDCIRLDRDCADECEKYDHEHCKDCAKACCECAEACRSSYAATA